MNQEHDVQSISPLELLRRWQAGEVAEVIDVRLPSFFAEAHLPFARSVPFATLDPGEITAARRSYAEEPVYVICQVGKLSREACRWLIDGGLGHVVNVEGGTRAWQEAGLPLVKEQGAVSLRRQVALAAGVLVTASSLLALFVHEALVLIPTLVGCCLICSAITDRCALAALLARLRWHRRGSAAAARPSAVQS